MKKIQLFFHLLCLSLFVAAQPTAPISISIKSNIEKEQNMLGLTMLRIDIVNQCDSAVRIHSPNQLFFKAHGRTLPMGIKFSERQIMSSNGQDIMTLKAHETLKVNANLNLFDLANNYFIETGKTFKDTTTISIRAGIYCRTDRQYYYSDSFQVVIKPLHPVDLEAFTYIRERGYDPYQFTSTGKITVLGIDETIAHEVLDTFPKSTFAELAGLSLAYKNAREARVRSARRSRALEQLEKPLVSKYSFVRYLAEELKKRVE